MPERIVSQGLHDDEERFEQTLRPSVMGEFIGQQAAKNKLAICLEAARKRGEPLDHVILSGPPGLGKTTLAGILAREMGMPMRTTSGPTLERKDDLAALLTAESDSGGGMLFIDEIHRLNRVVEECLYPAMEDFVIDIMIGDGPHTRSIRLDLERFTLIGATTRAGMISAPMRDRFGIQ